MTGYSRRRALALLLGVPPSARALPFLDTGPPIRLAMSESVLGDVNLNDARVATRLWLQRVSTGVNLVLDPKLFNTTQEILDRVRRNDVDAVAVTILEYRLMAPFLDSSELVSATDGLEQYLILAKNSAPARKLSDLKGSRLSILRNPKMCVAPAWLSAILDENRLGSPEQFFGSIANDTKVSRVVLPVFFGQSDCCLTTRHFFDAMCELNPQVGRSLTVVASSPFVMVAFYVFRRNYASAGRERLIRAVASVRNSAGGQQLATLFQFDELKVWGADSLTSALNILDHADRARARLTPGGRQ